MIIEITAYKDGEMGYAVGACVYGADDTLIAIMSAYHKATEIGSLREAVRQVVGDTLAIVGDDANDVQVYGKIRLLRDRQFERSLESKLRIAYPNISLKVRAACNVSEDCRMLAMDALERKETVSERL